MESVQQRPQEGSGIMGRDGQKERCSAFQMPLHYPRYKEADYQAMPEWRIDCLLREYGLPVAGDLADKRRFAIGAFVWPSH